MAAHIEADDVVAELVMEALTGAVRLRHSDEDQPRSLLR